MCLEQLAKAHMAPLLVGKTGGTTDSQLLGRAGAGVPVRS